MVDPIMYQEDHFVVLRPDQEEQFLTPNELLEYLEQIIVIAPEYLPRELDKCASATAKASYLRDNFCQLDLEPGDYIQWYVVRLTK